MNTSKVTNPIEIFLPLWDSLYTKIPLTIIQLTIFIIGLFENLIICIVLRGNKSMHNVANIYLFSLSTADILLLISGMPQAIYSIWIKGPYNFGKVFCILRGLVEETSANASVLTITLFSLERYFAICKPFLAHRISTVSQARRLVFILWAVSLGLAVLQALQLRIVTYGGVPMCLQTRTPFEYALEISTIITYFVPAMIITVCYTLIGLRISRMDRNQNSGENNELRRFIIQPLSNHNNGTNAQSTKKDIKMMIAVVVTFFICWTPFHAQRLMAIYSTSDNHLAKSPTLQSVYTCLKYFSEVFYYMSTCINPILYHVISKKFRDAFKATILERFGSNTSQPVAQQCCSAVVPMSRNADRGRSANSGKSNEEKLELKTFKSYSKKQDRLNLSSTRDEHLCERNMTTSNASTQDCDHRSNTQEIYI